MTVRAERLFWATILILLLLISGMQEATIIKQRATIDNWRQIANMCEH